MSEHIRVMISSTVRDLPQHREKVMDACMRLGVFYPDMMEHLIAIYERLVHQEQQMHLANDLASAYVNKAIALEEQSDFDEALACYEKSQLGWTFCVEHLNMFWETPNLLKILRYRLKTLLQLQLWPTAAREIMRFRALVTDYIEREGIDEGLKEAARNEMVEMISELRELSSEQRELLYGELGADGEPVRSLIDKAEGS